MATKITSPKLEGLLKLIPKGQSPKIYYDLIQKQVMGLDKQGNPRPEEDLFLFLYVCKRTSLDPLTKQIHAIYRWDTNQGRDRMTIQAGIDGLRLVAQRTGEYGGSDDIKYTPEEEKEGVYPYKAACTVYKINKITGERMPITATARWAEYFPKQENMQFMWKRMPYNQLGKCAEAQALRRAFPNELSGIYSEDEMQQAGSQLAELPAPESKVKIEKPQNLPKATNHIDLARIRNDLKEDYGDTDRKSR